MSIYELGGTNYWPLARAMSRRRWRTNAMGTELDHIGQLNNISKLIGRLGLAHHAGSSRFGGVFSQDFQVGVIGVDAVALPAGGLAKNPRLA